MTITHIEVTREASNEEDKTDATNDIPTVMHMNKEIINNTVTDCVAHSNATADLH